MIKVVKIKKIFLIAIIFVIIAIFGYIAREYTIKFLYQKKYADIVEKYAQEYNIDSNMIYAIIKVESNFKENSVSSKGATGLMQLMENTAEEIAKEVEMPNYSKELLTTPDVNIHLRSSLFCKAIKKIR